MKFHDVVVWVEAHPGESVLIGGVSVIALIWLFGGFSRTASDNGQSSLAAAYYAAEAQQAVVGGQIQQATIGAAAQTAQAKIAADAATAINMQNTTTANAINTTNNATLVTVGNQQLQATQSNNATLLTAQQQHNDAVLKMNDANNSASLMSILLGTVIPQELTYSGGAAAFDFSKFGLGSGGINVTGGTAPTQLKAQGFNDTAIQQMLNLPGPFGAA